MSKSNTTAFRSVSMALSSRTGRKALKSGNSMANAFMLAVQKRSAMDAMDAIESKSKKAA